MNKLLCHFPSGYVEGCAIAVSFCLLFSCNETTTTTASRKNIIESVYASGKIIAENEHGIFALSNGSVIKKMVEDGDTVRKGQALFEINNISTTAGLNVAADKLKFIQQFALPEKETDKSYIRSDCNGIVYQTMKEQGEAVHSNEPVALIGDASNRVIRMAVDQQDIDKIKTGQQVLLKTDVTGDSVYKASVTKIYSVMNEASQTFRVDAIFADPFPYQFIHNSVEANIIIMEKKGALVVPRNAMVGNDSLWAELNGKAQKIKVKPGIATQDYTEILEGLDENTRILLKSQQ